MTGTDLLRVTVVVAAITACKPSISGPEPIVWGREVCTRCQMVISDRNDAAQLRSAHDHRLHFFDDLGCAVLWEEEEARSGHRVEEFWVSNGTETGWQEAAKAKYSGGHRTPMDHGFRVTDASDSSAEFDLQQVRERIVEMERERRSSRG